MKRSPKRLVFFKIDLLISFIHTSMLPHCFRQKKINKP